MKKAILLAAVAIVATTVLSCRKDSTCTCKSGSTNVTSIKAKSTKKDAKAWCDAIQAEVNSNGGTTTCEVE